MSKIYGKRKKRYVECTGDQSQLTCLINGPGNSPDELEVLIDFSSKDNKIIPTKECTQEPEFKKIGWYAEK